MTLELDPDVAELLAGPAARPAPPDRRALFADAYEPGLPEAALVEAQRKRLAEAGQLPATAIFAPPDAVFDRMFLGTGPGPDLKGIQPVRTSPAVVLRLEMFTVAIFEPRSFIEIVVA